MLNKIKEHIKIPDFVILLFIAMTEWVLMSFVLTDIDFLKRQPFPAMETQLFLLVTLMAFYSIVKRLWLSVIVHSVLFYIYCLIQFFAIQLRGTIFYLSDLYNIKTAANVANSYKLEFNGRFWISVLVMLVIIGIGFLCRNRRFKLSSWKRVVVVAVCILGSIGSVWLMKATQDHYQYNNFFKGWYLNGYVFEFIGTSDIQLKAPEGYVREDYKELLKTDCEELKTKPNVIFIMNESFMDPDTHDFTDRELIPFMKELAMDENCVSGKLHSSVIGGMTACMEFEAMTGYSSKFSGSVVQYTAYMKNGNSYNSLASLFDELGYETTSFHPYIKSGYNRQTAYQTMGFENYIGIEDLDDTEKGVVVEGRESYVSDAYDYDKLFEIMERSEAPDFILNVTMQNHGGYEEQGLLDISSELGAGASTLNGYLYLLSLTDGATKELVERLKTYDEPVVFVFFGDHQPEPVQYIQTENELIKYVVPYYIWANFDLNTDIAYTENTSANYLANILFEAIWDKQPNSWYSYLEELRNKYPVISKNVILNNENQIVEDELTEYRTKGYYYIWEQEK